MDTLQHLLEQEIAKVPRLHFEKLIAKKLHAQGITATKALSRELTEHLLSGCEEPFSGTAGKYARDVTITLDKADVDEITRALDDFCENNLPKIIREAAAPISKTIHKDLHTRWASEHAQQIADSSEFRDRLEERWGKPLDQLRMLLTIAREWCQDKVSKADKTLHLKTILIRLLVRACQVTDEVICLLENGFADGAMARWRTLHEIAVVASVLSRLGEDIAERYVAHQAVESMRAMNKYVNCCEHLGYKPIPAREIKKITDAYNAAIAKYGKGFKSDYGWAASHLNKDRPSFSDLEEIAGRAEMRAHYQMANDNVHAGIKSIFVRLGLLDDYTGLLAGRSNAGLIEPGQNTAHTLTQLSVLVCLSEASLDDLVFAHVMKMIRDEIPRSFANADRRLRRDDNKYKTLRHS